MGEGRREYVCVHKAGATKWRTHTRIIAGDDVIQSEQYAQRAQTIVQNAAINKHRYQVGEHMQLFCSCDVMLALKLVCELANKNSMSHVEVVVPT